MLRREGLGLHKSLQQRVAREGVRIRRRRWRRRGVLARTAQGLGEVAGLLSGRRRVVAEKRGRGRAPTLLRLRGVRRRHRRHRRVAVVIISLGRAPAFFGRRRAAPNTGLVGIELVDGLAVHPPKGRLLVPHETRARRVHRDARAPGWAGSISRFSVLLVATRRTITMGRVF